MKQYDVTEYVALDGSKPFAKWVLGLKDAKARYKIAARINRASLGNFGDWKRLANTDGVCELREHYGPGYRIFYAIDQGKVIVLLAGSIKRDQKKMIAAAKERWIDYQARSKDNDS